jgi:hypothetical protein
VVFGSGATRALLLLAADDGAPSFRVASARRALPCSSSCSSRDAALACYIKANHVIRSRNYYYYYYYYY